ncbi:hypothetical protein LOK74_01665 [Brevibacillus humidisoli]|uniref:hypothetical protein n=1 Tax=Brevibacillus humidisoli TaxID=2895522 RepID=UPI001E5D1B2E|nr:hypothetical protein [Brevibacillus humidisoli]UFJ41286.1 hypothetical protein LOK74_01665 [Brevibacillus humidisoli]
MTKGENAYPQSPEARDPKMSSKMMEVVGFENPDKTEHHKQDQGANRSRDVAR